MIRLLSCALIWLALALPAAAHKLKVFASVEGRTVSGYGFFIGGGRPESVSWTARDGGDTRIAAGATDANGAFRFEVPANFVSDLTITIDTQEGHIASSTLTASRFGAAAPPSGTQTASQEPGVSNTPSETDMRTAQLVEAAVQRQIEPLMERIEEMDSRMRYTDALSGVFLIIGLAGIVLWLRAGRR